MSWERLLQSSLSRRDLLQSAGQIGLAATTLEVLGCSTEPDVLRQSKVALPLDDQERGIGLNSLKFEQAKGLVPQIAALYSESTKSRQKPDEIVANTFIVRGDFYWKGELIDDVPIQDLYALEGIANFREDYPNFDLTEERVKDLASAFRGTNIFFSTIAFVSEENHVFISLDQINRPDPDPAFSEIGHTVNCETASPAIKLRSTLLHELVHREVDAKERPADPKVAAAINRHFKESWEVKTQKGFKVNAKNIKYDYETALLNLLDEFITDYIATNASLANGLKYTPSYTPSDYTNLEVILRAADISPLELHRLHRASDLGEFLRKLGRGIRQNPFAPGRKSSLDQGLEIAYVLSGSIPIQWEKLQENFPKVDPARYGYPDTPFGDIPTQGCLNFLK